MGEILAACKAIHPVCWEQNCPPAPGIPLPFSWLIPLLYWSVNIEKYIRTDWNVTANGTICCKMSITMDFCLKTMRSWRVKLEGSVLILSRIRSCNINCIAYFRVEWLKDFISRHFFLSFSKIFAGPFYWVMCHSCTVLWIVCPLNFQRKSGTSAHANDKSNALSLRISTTMMPTTKKAWLMIHDASPCATVMYVHQKVHCWPNAVQTTSSWSSCSQTIRRPRNCWPTSM